MRNHATPHSAHSPGLLPLDLPLPLLTPCQWPVQDDYIEIIKPLSDEEMALALKRMEAKAIKQAKEARVAERRARAKVMGFAISPSTGEKEGKGAPAVFSSKVAG